MSALTAGVDIFGRTDGRQLTSDKHRFGDFIGITKPIAMPGSATSSEFENGNDYNNQLGT